MGKPQGSDASRLDALEGYISRLEEEVDTWKLTAEGFADELSTGVIDVTPWASIWRARRQLRALERVAEEARSVALATRPTRGAIRKLEAALADLDAELAADE